MNELKALEIFKNNMRLFQDAKGWTLVFDWKNCDYLTDNEVNILRENGVKEVDL